MVSSDDLAARVLAAIQVTERIAQDAVQETTGRWTARESEFGVGTFVEDDCGAIILYADPDRGRRNVQYPHIARNDPETVLRHCDTDRRTVERHSRPGRAEVHGSQDGTFVLEWCDCCGEPMPCPDLLDRAAAYDITTEKHQEGRQP